MGNSIKNGVTPNKSSIKREIFQSSALLALIIVIIFGLILSTIQYQSEISEARAVLNRTNHGVALFIDGYFSEIINTITMLDESRDIRNAMSLGEDEHRRILDVYRSILKANRNITYVYSGYESGLMLINDYTPPKEFEPSSRPWYKAAMASKPETSVGLPYQDIKSKVWLVSTGKALKQADGGYGGVVAVDCSFDKVSDLIAQHNEYQTEFSFVLDRSGITIMHPDPAELGKTLPELNEVILNKTDGAFTYLDHNTECFAHYRKIAATGWTVVTVVEKREILRPIVSKVLLLVVLTGFIAVALGFVQSIQLGRRFSRPLVELGRKIKATIAGNDPESDGYVYPDNEIGIMAREIGQLAENELIARSRELQASERQQRLLIEHAVSAVAAHRIVLDEAGHPVDYVYLSANPAFETHTGLRVADILGRRATEVLPGIDRPPFIDIYSRVVQSGEPASFEQYSEPLGRYYFTNVYRVDEACFATIFIDITERKLSEIALQEKNAVLDSFNNTISHDLKSPLITIQSFAGMIARDIEAGDHTRARDDMKMIEGAAEKMAALLNDLLALSKIGKMMNDPTQIDMNQLVRDVLAQLAGPLGKHQVRLVVQPDLPPMLGDRLRIAEVVQNLVENAIKYMGDQAEPRIEIGARLDGNIPVLFVRDNGLGIDEGQHEKIFGLFNKLDVKSEGYGVGLALVKQIIGAHGGRVWVESAGLGTGSDFCFTLPGKSL